MARLEMVPFSDEHLDAAAGLLAERHARHLATEPLLAQVADFRAQLETAWQRDGATGAVALRNGRAVGYLVGAPAGEARVEVGLAGHATAEPEAARDLYAHVAQGWFDRGLTRHAVYVPASDAMLVDAWFHLAFGLQFTFAAREIAPEPDAAAGAGLTVRAGRPRDIEHAAMFDRGLWEHQAVSPSFSGMVIPPLGDVVDDWGGTWGDPQFAHFVAERHGRVVGHALLYLRPPGDLRIPSESIDLAQAFVIPEVRGGGAGMALWRHAVRWAHAQGYRSMTTDWRTVNLLSSRFWSRRGFRPTFYRLYRAIP